MDGNKTKDADRVAAGLKGLVALPAYIATDTVVIADLLHRAMHNPQISEEAQFAAAEKLGEVQK